MRIAVATTEGGLDDQVAPNFGRAPTFTIVDVEGEEVKRAEVEPNPAAGAAGGAGIQAAQWVANSGARAVIAGNFGPNASGALAQAGIETYTASGMTVREAVEALLRGELTPFEAGAMAGPGPGPGMGPGFGFGSGPGSGRGMGYGRGQGRGMGGWGRGGWGAGAFPSGPGPGFGPAGFPSPPPPGPGTVTREDEIRFLRERARMLEEQLEWIKRRLRELS